MADLTTLSNAKQFLRITGTTDDALITRLVTACSEFIQTWLNKELSIQTYTEKFSGTGNQFHICGDYPITSITSVVVNDLSIPLSQNTNTAGYINDDEQIALQGYVFARGRLNCVITYQAGYSIIPPEIEQACLELIATKYKQIEHIEQSSKVVAGETVAFITSDIPAFIKVTLKNYKKVISF
jgi:hypothetical protein